MNAATLTRTDVESLTHGTVLVLETKDRRRPFRATVNTEGGPSFLDTKRASVCFVWQANDTLSHVMRYPVSRMAMPTTTDLVEISLAQ